MNISDLKKSDYPPFFETYLSIIKKGNVVENLKTSLQTFMLEIYKITEEQSCYSYARGKWTIKQIISHLADAERILTYRALCIGRGEKKNLPGYNHNSYVDTSNSNNLPFKNIVSEVVAVRQASIAMFENFNDAIYRKNGLINDDSMSVLALGFIISSHLLHHLQVIEEKYL